MTESNGLETSSPLEISDKDIYEAMKEIPGYLDITPGDFKDLYKLVYHHTLERISQAVKASDIMTRTVVTVTPETPVMEAAGLMAVKEVSGVPVIDKDNTVVGVLSERDFLSRMGGGGTKNFMTVVARCLEAKGCAAVAIREKTVKDIMTSPAVTVNRHARSLDIAALLKKKKINRVPVIDQSGCLVGIISREDIVNTSLIEGIS
ncbi:MAG: CBS domain-containing protein [Deltaproteobacteria bacterium]|nr:CBS domain-containing protein [Deltaproteobacteria bacterium]